MSRCEELRRLHHGPAVLVLPNAWDVASARAFAALPGCRALATSSAALVRSLGFEDGEHAPVDEVLRVVERIVAAVDVPVTADLEAGYGDPQATAVRALAAGAAGLNLEDSRDGAMLDLEDQVAILRAVRTAAPELVVNARVDVFLRGGGGGVVDEAVRRGNAYLAAGADCVYPIDCPFETIGQLVAGIDGPVNVLVSPDEPNLDELARLGVARVTFGSGLARVGLERAATAAAAWL